MKRTKLPLRGIVVFIAALFLTERTADSSTELWSRVFNNVTQVFPDAFVGSPAIGGDGTVYIAGILPDNNNGGQRRLYALNGSTGAILSGWPVFLGARISTASGLTKDKGAESTPAIGPDGHLYIGSWNYNVYKINPTTRATNSWTPTGTQPKGVLRTAPIVINGYVYCWFDGDPLADSSLRKPHLVILNASDMSYVGAWVPDNGVLGSAIASPALGRNNILYGATHLISGSDRLGNIYAIDVSVPSNPQLYWGYPPDCIGAIVSSPVIGANGHVFVGTQEGEMNGVAHAGSLICFDSESAVPWDPLWSREVGGNRPVDGTPAIRTDGRLYIPMDPSATAISALGIADPLAQVDGGALDFEGGFNAPSGERFDSSPVLGADGSIFAKTVNTFSAAAKLYHLTAGMGFLESFDLGNDSLAWHKDPVDGGISTVFSSPAIGPDGKLYIATAGTGSSGSGKVICYETGIAGHSFWPNFRGNLNNTGSVQDNKWTTNATINASITALASYPTAGHNQALAVNIAGKAVGYQPYNGHYGASCWSAAQSSYPNYPTAMTGLSVGYYYNFVANGLNDLNQAVGSQTMDVYGTLHALYWPSLTNTPIDLALLATFNQAEALEINASGLIAGSGKNLSGKWRAMRWNAQTPTVGGDDLTTLNPNIPSLQSYGYGIGIRGWTVGKSQSVSNGTFRAFATPSSRDISGLLDNLSGTNQAEAHAVNGLGQIVGSSANGATPEHAWIWLKKPNDTIFSSKDLGTLNGGTTSRALAINNRGQVVGWASGSGGSTFAFIWIPGWTSIRDLRSFLSSTDATAWPQLSVAFGITDDGTVVGYGTPSGSSFTSGFAIKPKS